MLIHCPVQWYGFFFPSLVTRLCRGARVLENRDLDRKVKREHKFWADKVIIGKNPAGPAEVDSEESDAPEEGNEDVVASLPHEPDVWVTSGGSWDMGMSALEQDMAGKRTSVTDLGTRMDALATQNAKSEKTIMAWLRALGRACQLDPRTISDTD